MELRELRDLINGYLETQLRHDKDEQKQARKLFLGESKTSFISLCKKYPGKYDIAVRESVTAYKSKKQEAINRYKGLVAFLNGKMPEEIKVDWPPVDISSRLDRVIYIMKRFQTEPEKQEGLKGSTIAETLADELWMSTRTIEDDLASIQNKKGSNSISFLDRSLAINGLKRSGGTIHFLSSVHPIFLMENLTGVVVMIHALLEKAKQPARKGWAMATAGHAWSQLTDYAKERVEKTTRNLYAGDPTVLRLFEELKAMPVEGYFMTEREMTKGNICNLIGYCEKAGVMCICSYTDEDGAITEIIGYPCTTGPDGSLLHMRRPDGSEKIIRVSDVKYCEKSED